VETFAVRITIMLMSKGVPGLPGDNPTTVFSASEGI
jgi:hypothetical protein